MYYYSQVQCQQELIDEYAFVALKDAECFDLNTTAIILLKRHVTCCIYV